MLRAQVSERSQAHVLKRRMQEVGFTHGQEARVNLRGVRVAPMAASEATIFFCDMKRMEVLNVVKHGDGASLPDSAVVEELYFPREGTHDILGAIITSNGSLQVKADEATKVVHRQWAWW